MTLFMRKQRRFSLNRKDWTWWDEKANDIVRLVLPGEAGRRHVVDAIHASYQVPGISGLLTWQFDGLTLRGRWYVFGHRDLYGPLIGPPGADVAVTLHLSNRSDIQCEICPCLMVRGHTQNMEST